MMELVFSQSAQKDLVRLRQFIAKHNPQAVRSVSQQLIRSITLLVKQPEMGMDLPELPGVQQLVTGNYIVRYTLMQEKVIVLRIWHGKENR